jgi:hypothetical protein
MVLACAQQPRKPPVRASVLKTSKTTMRQLQTYLAPG